jgi:hypothetical protein
MELNQLNSPQKGKLTDEYQELDNIISEYEKLWEAEWRSQFLSNRLSREHDNPVTTLMRNHPIGKIFLNGTEGDVLLAIMKFRETKKNIESKQNWFSWNSLNKSEFLKSLIFPMLLILFTAFATNFVGRSLQEQKFKNEKYFDMQMEAIKQGRKNAIEINNDARQLMRQIDSNEDFAQDIFNKHRLNPSQFQNQYDEIISYDWEGERKEIIKIENKISELNGYVRLFDKSSNISSVISNNIKLLVQIVECLDKKEYNCSKQLQDKVFESFSDLEESFTKATIDLVEKRIKE